MDLSLEEVEGMEDLRSTASSPSIISTIDYTQPSGQLDDSLPPTSTDTIPPTQPTNTGTTPPPVPTNTSTTQPPVPTNPNTLPPPYNDQGLQPPPPQNTRPRGRGRARYHLRNPLSTQDGEKFHVHSRAIG